ncbi:hypothetical protein GWI33_018925 [Rhynchophorus ferrugineus]|uniref:Secreted protein n=1 Tax=Rhynchophorus ferrugineus TaxID=354439 RepID=A0A834HUX9_RHYFE|nr:hypothetical protein GWI33_018925 [Rhynchophorus ferrugineus]
MFATQIIKCFLIILACFNFVEIFGSENIGHASVTRAEYLHAQYRNPNFTRYSNRTRNDQSINSRNDNLLRVRCLKSQSRDHTGQCREEYSRK